MVNTTPRQLSPREGNLVPTSQEGVWALGQFWTDAKNLAFTGFDPQTVQSAIKTIIVTGCNPYHKHFYLSALSTGKCLGKIRVLGIEYYLSSSVLHLYVKICIANSASRPNKLSRKSL